MKKFSKKICFVLLTIVILINLLCCSNVFTFSNSNIQDEYSESFIEAESISLEDILNSETNENEITIMKYDKETETTTEVDMDEIRELVAERRTSNNTTRTESYNPNPIMTGDLIPSIMPRTTFYSIATPTDYPNRCICKTTCSGGSGTGFLVGPNLLLTAAHCVFDGSYNFYSNWMAYPGYNYGNYNGYGCGWSTIYYSTGGGLQDDWCLCVLGTSLGNNVGWIGCQSYGSNSEMNGLNVTTQGYLGALDNGQRQYYSPGSITSVSDGYVFSTAGSKEGMSGGPLRRTSDNYAVGIIKGYLTNDPSTSVEVRIHQNIIDLINSLN